MQNSSRKYKQTKFSSTVEGLYVMTKWDLFLECKDDKLCCVFYDHHIRRKEGNEKRGNVN